MFWKLYFTVYLILGKNRFICTNEAAIEKYLEVANCDCRLLFAAVSQFNSSKPTLILHTCMIKVIFAAFIIAPAHLIQRLLFLSGSFVLRFFFYNARTNAQQVLPKQTGLYRYDERMLQNINDENLMLTNFNVS